jgi:hypothetical protein
MIFTLTVIVGCEKDDFSWNLSKKPVVVTHEEMVYSDSTMTLVIKGEVLKDEGSPITQRGVVWSNSSKPTMADNYTSNGKGIGKFSSSIVGLTESKTYYIRAYATNNVGTSYGEEIIFTAPTNTPIVSTTVVSNITTTSAVSGGNISDEGGSPITQRGVVWSNLSNPTLADNYTSNGVGIGNYASNLTGLTVNTTYYVRAYATNSFGTSYGETRNFIVPDNIPIVSTTVGSNITSTSAIIGGNVSFEGGSPITQRGVVWNTSINPTLSDNYSSNGVGIGVFSNSITSLNPSTKYYVRAYAVNSFGTSYGNQVEIQTLDPVPVLISTNPCNSLLGINSSYEHWHSSSYDSHSWTVSNGYIGNCYISDGNYGGLDAKNGYIEFPITINGSGYLTFWIRSGTSGTWHGANRIPNIFVDGVQLPTPTVIQGQNEFSWQKFKSSQISGGNHIIKVYWNNSGSEDLLKIDEIEIWELQ